MSVIPIELINATPGFAGRLTQLIIKTALYKQPQLALAASLAAVGTLKGQKVASETDLRTNHLIVGLGPPSSGKGHALKVIDKLFHQIGADHYIGGKPASDTGLLASIVRGGGVKIVQWDEFGLDLKKITSPKAPAYKAGILRIVMELFSSADKYFRGDEYTNADSKRPRIDIYQPCFNLYGVSTPIRFYEALNSDFGSDGFLSRLLIFDSGLEHPQTNKDAEPFYIPDAIVESGKRIFLEKTPEPDPDAIDSIDGPIPIRIPFANNAKQFIYRELHAWNEKKRKEGSEIFQSIFGRALEHIIKIALTVEPQDEIQLSTLQWADEIYKHLLDTLLTIMNKHVSNTDFERSLNKVKNYLREKGTVSQNEFCRANQYLNLRERDEILKMLQQSGHIEYRREALAQGAGKPRVMIHFLD